MSLFFLSALSLSSCSKNKDTTSAPTDPPPQGAPKGTMDIHFVYAVGTTEPTHELIITGRNKTILLDTIMPNDDKLVATLHTDDSLVDVCNVYKYVNTFYVEAFNGVNPTTWVMQHGNATSTIPRHGGTTERATVHYRNAPNLSAKPFFNAYAGVSTVLSAADWATGNYIDESYIRHPGNYDYLLLPDLGLYKMHIPASDADTVDLAQMDTAVKLNFVRSSRYTLTPITLLGVMDTTDYTKSIWLVWQPDYQEPLVHYDVDLEYPGKYVQKYQLVANATNGAAQETVSFMSYADSIPTVIPYPDPSNYTIGSSTNNNFSASFQHIRPTFYSTYWYSPKLSFALFASPDSLHLNALAYLNGLHSQFLDGMDLSDLRLSTFSFEHYEGMNYRQYTDFLFGDERYVGGSPVIVGYWKSY